MSIITVTDRYGMCNGSVTRYRLSNGWFIDGSKVRAHRHMNEPYSVWEPGGDPSGCAGYRGGAPTLKLALSVANGGTVCGLADLGCRELATGKRQVDVRGRTGWVFHCARHQREGEAYQPVQS